MYQLRQKGRLKAKSVIDCEPNKNSIGKAITKLYSHEHQEKLTTVKNPYGSGGGASKAIVNILRYISLDDILKKTFYDFKPSLKSFF